MIGREGVKYLGEFDFVFEFMESIVKAAEGVDVLLVLPSHLHLRSTALSLHSFTHPLSIHQKENFLSIEKIFNRKLRFSLLAAAFFFVSLGD